MISGVVFDAPDDVSCESPVVGADLRELPFAGRGRRARFGRLTDVDVGLGVLATSAGFLPVFLASGLSFRTARFVLVLEGVESLFRRFSSFRSFFSSFLRFFSSFVLFLSRLVSRFFDATASSNPPRLASDGFQRTPC